MSNPASKFVWGPGQLREVADGHSAEKRPDPHPGYKPGTNPANPRPDYRKPAGFRRADATPRPDSAEQGSPDF